MQNPFNRFNQICLITAGLSLAAFGQADSRLWTVSGGGGYSKVAGTGANNLSGQWAAEFAAGFCMFGNQRVNPSVSLYLNIDYFHNRASVTPSALELAKQLNPTVTGLLSATGGESNFDVIALNPTLRFHAQGKVVPYVFGGFGYFRRQVDLTGVATQGSLLQPGNPAVFLRDTGSGSVDGGAGITFKTKGNWPGIYVEVRAVHGLAINHSTTLVPVVAGFRW